MCIRVYGNPARGGGLPDRFPVYMRKIASANINGESASRKMGTYCPYFLQTAKARDRIESDIF
jgi:hypothetical protein